MAVWGVDLGGTKIECAVIDNEKQPYDVLVRRRIPTEREKGYEHILNRVRKLVEECVDEVGIVPTEIGFATPGSLDPQTGLLKNSNTVCFNGKPLRKDLEQTLEVPVKLANDANCFALAETHMGVVKQTIESAEVVFGIIMGSGVGGGIVINGKIIEGLHGIGGEWGHNYLDHSGGECYCGQTGCVETIISGKGLERYYKEQSGVNKKLDEIYQEYLIDADKHAVSTINRLLTYFGKSVAVVINILDPDAIVIGGGVGNIDHLYTEGVKEVQKHIFNPTCKARILKPLLGDSAGVFGAAFLVV